MSDENSGDQMARVIREMNAEIARLRAEVERLTRAALRTSSACPSCGDDISFASARSEEPDAPADAIMDGAESFCRECNVRARWTCDAETAGSVVLDFDEDRKEYAAEIARLTRERDEARSRVLAAEMDCDVAYAKLEGTWPNAQIDKLREEWAAMNAAADRFCADWKKAEARVAELEAALLPFAEAHRNYRAAPVSSKVHPRCDPVVCGFDVWRDADRALLAPEPTPCATCGDPAHAAADALAMDYRCPECGPKGGGE